MGDFLLADSAAWDWINLAWLWLAFALGFAVGAAVLGAMGHGE